MGGDEVDCHPLWDAGTADDEWDAHVFFVGAALTGAETMLADMEAVVARVDDVRVVEQIVAVEAVDGSVD